MVKTIHKRKYLASTRVKLWSTHEAQQINIQNLLGEKWNKIQKEWILWTEAEKDDEMKKINDAKRNDLLRASDLEKKCEWENRIL